MTHPNFVLEKEKAVATHAGVLAAPRQPGSSPPCSRALPKERSAFGGAVACTRKRLSADLRSPKGSRSGSLRVWVGRSMYSASGHSPAG